MYGIYGLRVILLQSSGLTGQELGSDFKEDWGPDTRRRHEQDYACSMSIQWCC